MTHLEKLYEQRCNESSDINKHLPFLFNRVRGHFLELGVRDGHSTTAFLLCAKSLVSVDEVMCPSLNIVKDAYLQDETQIPWRIIISNDLDVDFKGKCFDVVFIDTNHTYEHLVRELKKFGPLARRNIILHDTVSCWDFDKGRGKEGIGRAIMEFVGENKEWVIEISDRDQNGMMVLTRKEFLK